MARQMQEYVEARRIARMSHEPSDGPDDVVVKSFLPLNGVKPPTPNPFPALRPNSQVDRQHQAQLALHFRPSSTQNGGNAALSPPDRANGARRNQAGSPNPLSVNGMGRGTALGSTSPAPSSLSQISTAIAAANKPKPERIVLPPPSSRWYPGKDSVKPAMGEALDPSVPASVESPRAMQRAWQRTHVASEVQSHFLVNPPPGVGGKKKRKSSASASGRDASKSPPRASMGSAGGSGPTSAKKKKGVLACAPAIPSTTDAIAAVVTQQAEAASAGQPYVPANLKGLMAVVKCFMDDRGRLTPVAFTKALKDLGVNDASTADNIFRRLESRASPGYVHYGTIIAAFHEVLNSSATQDVIVNHCFSLFDLENRGYIHKEHLSELKMMRVTLNDHPVVTPLMVKVLNDLFADVKAKEEEYYVTMVIRKGKAKSKKKPPPLKTFQNSVIPVERKVVQHIDRTLFKSYFATHREVSLAFAPRWIPMIDTNDAIGVAASEAMLRYENPSSPSRGGGENGDEAAIDNTFSSMGAESPANINDQFSNADVSSALGDTVSGGGGDAVA